MAKDAPIKRVDVWGEDGTVLAYVERCSPTDWGYRHPLCNTTAGGWTTPEDALQALGNHLRAMCPGYKS